MKVTGLNEVRSALKAAPKKVQKAIVNTGTQAVAQEVAKGARRHAMSHGGGLAKYAKVIAVKKEGKGNKRIVGWKKPFSGLAHLFEFGTTERVQKKTGRRTGRMPMQPHLRPAVEEMNVQQIEAIFTKATARRLNLIFSRQK